MLLDYPDEQGFLLRGRTHRTIGCKPVRVNGRPARLLRRLLLRHFRRLSLQLPSGPDPVYSDRAGLFRGLGPDGSRRLECRLEEVRLPAGEPLFRLGDPSDAMFLIAEGAVDIVRGDGAREGLIDTLFPGEPVGELQLLAGGKRTATARARDPALLVRLSRSAFDAEAREVP